jgi:hypothetical protein
MTAPHRLVHTALAAVAAAVVLTACNPTDATQQGAAPATTAAASSGAATTAAPRPATTRATTAATRPAAPATPAAPKPATAKPAPVRTTAPVRKAPKPASTCGAPANSWGYNFCLRGGFIHDPASGFCDVFDCIPSFWDSTNGYVMQCADGLYSHSGGRSGSCSHHGGNRRALYG